MILRLSCLVPVFMLLSPGAHAGACRPDQLQIRTANGQTAFSVEVADDEGERAKGLMFRTRMPPDHGMIFVYPDARPVAFWMHNTPLPLDMLFAGADGRVRSVHAMAQPYDDTPIPGGESIQYVVEINGGLAKELGITPGAALRHPAIPKAIAAWPCD